MKRLTVLSLVAVALLVAGCRAGTTPTPAAGPAELVVMTHDSFAVTESLVAAFEQQNNVKLTFLKSGDAGAALNKAILSKELAPGRCVLRRR